MRSSSAADIPKSAGFTLVELLLVLVIVAAGAAIAVPRYSSSLTRARLDSATRQLVQRLNFARATARATSSEVSVTLDAEGPVTISGLPASYGSGVEARVGSGTIDLTADPFRLESVVTSFPTGSAITFDAFGRSNTGGAELHLGGGKRVVMVDANGGIRSD